MGCDNDVAAVRDASGNFGYRTVLTAASGALPFADGEDEFVFCSDLIERVAGLKMGVLAVSSSKEFRLTVRQHQSRFTEDIRVSGLKYCVQSSHRHIMTRDQSQTWRPVPSFCGSDC